MKDKPYLSPSRVSVESLGEYQEKHRNLGKEEKKLLDTISEDDKMKGLILMNVHGAASVGWKTLKNEGSADELKEYLRFLTGVKPRPTQIDSGTSEAAASLLHRLRTSV